MDAYLPDYAASTPSEPQDSGDSSQGRVKKRHTKSRAGCKTCKRRKVKCDEQKPACGNCARLHVSCDFLPFPADLPPKPVVRKRGRPTKDWNHLVTYPFRENKAPTLGQLNPSLSAVSTAPPSLNADDLELLYHYVSCTAATLGYPPFWRDDVPRLGFTCHYLLRVVLVISARHLTLLRPQKAALYERLADQHLTIALREITENLSNLSQQNCRAVFISMMLVCFSTLAIKPRPGHLLMIAEDGDVPWWDMLRGVRFVLQDSTRTELGEFGPPDAKETPRLDVQIRSVEVVSWELAIEKLHRLIDTELVEDMDLFTGSVDQLAWCFEFTFGTSDHPKDLPDGRVEVVMSWMYCTQDRFIESVKQKHPISLAILAHFAILLKSLEGFWFMRGWAAHIIHRVCDMMDSEHQQWIQWPMKTLEHLTCAQL